MSIRSSQRGVTLVELMVAMVLGLIVTGAALAVFVTNRQTYLATENLGRLQENARIAFELMSRDLRQGAMVPCANEEELDLNFANAIDSAAWWNDWEDGASGMIGYASGDATFPFAAGAGGRVNGTDALELKASEPVGASPVVITAAAAASADIPVSTIAGITVGDAMVACDYGESGARSAAAAVFQVTGLNGGANPSIEHGTTGVVPANDTNDLVTGLQLQENGQVSFLRATRWYIGNNPVGGTSLYRSRLQNTAGTLGVASDEIVRNATDLTLTYLLENGASYVGAAAVGANWNNVVAVRMELALQGTDNIDGAPIQRTLEQVVTVRNRAL